MHGKKIACEHQYMMGSDFRHTLQGRDGFFLTFRESARIVLICAGKGELKDNNHRSHYAAIHTQFP